MNRVYCCAMLCYIVLCGCKSVPLYANTSDFTYVWAPENITRMAGENYFRAIAEWNICTKTGDYIGMDINNLDKRKSKICKDDGNGGKICAYLWIYYEKTAYGNDIPYTMIFNLYVKNNGIIYKCRTERI